MRQSCQCCALDHVDDGQTEKILGGGGCERGDGETSREGGEGGRWVTLSRCVGCNGAAEGVADEDKSAGHSRSTYSQNIARKAVWGGGGGGSETFREITRARRVQ